MAKNKNIFVTSDLWFNRPMGEFSYMTNEEYNSMIIDNWNDVVCDDDIVYVLGGFGIGDCYDIVLKLKGEIHFLNSVFSESDSFFRNCMKTAVENSVNKNLVKKIIFENDQILTLPKMDCVLSYFPLSDWAGKTTKTLCFHGYTNNHNLNDNTITCKSDVWSSSPVEIKEIKNNFSNFKKLLSK